MDHVIELDGVSKTFVVHARVTHALRGVSLRIAAAGVTGLAGPDGAGKTTLMRLVAGLLAPDTGTITVLGLDVATRAAAVQAAIGYMPQRFGLYQELTVGENLDLYADLGGVPRPARPERYAEVIEMAGLGPFIRRQAGRLSGGMKQKLGLACTLVRAPRLLLLDEPTAGVDPVSRRELWRIIERMVRERGTSVLVSTAYLDEAQRCREVAVLDRGELLDHDAPGVFSRRVAGRTWEVTAPIGARRIQGLVAGRPGVVDAVADGGRVRVVASDDVPPAAATLLPGVAGARVEPIEPRFEDAFMAMLRGRRAEADAGDAAAPDAEAAARPDRPRATAIEVRGVERRFGAFVAVRGISFEVRRGEVFGLLGANGAGKTTTFRMLCGLLPASAGSLRVAGVDMRRAAPSARAKIGYMSQHFSQYGNLSVTQNLRFFASAYGLSGPRRRRRMTWALDTLDLRSFAAAAAATLPTGYKQRLALGCALMHEPEILFLDEPTSGIDPLARRVFWQRINTLAGAGVTVMVTTHFMQEADYCDRLAIMAEGRILTLGTPASIRAGVESPGRPQPTIEDAFIRLVEADRKGETGGA